MDSTCVLIGQQVCFDSVMKNENDVVIWLAVSKLWELTVSWKKLKYTYASHIVFLFAKTENDNFIKEIKHVISAFIARWKPRQSLWEFSRR